MNKQELINLLNIADNIEEVYIHCKTTHQFFSIKTIHNSGFDTNIYILVEPKEVPF